MKPLLKITFTVPQLIYQDGILNECSFLLAKNISKRNKSVVIWDKETNYVIYFTSLIKSIEFIQPNEFKKPNEL